MDFLLLIGVTVTVILNHFHKQFLKLNILNNFWKKMNK